MNFKEQKRQQIEKITSRSGINDLFPGDLNFKGNKPIIFHQEYKIDYIHSFGQDSPFFLGLKNKKLLGSECTECGLKYATPRSHCMEECGVETKWIEVPNRGKIHAFTVCNFGSEMFLEETPFILVVVEFEGFSRHFLSRVKGLDPNSASLDWIGMDIEVRFKEGIDKEGYVPSVADVWFMPVEKISQ